jgi:5-hydroxyisourate hydrolase
MSTRSPITTHVLDLQRGRPAAAIAVTLEYRSDDGWRTLGRGTTDGDGRVEALLAAGSRPERGMYRLTFDTGAWFASQEIQGFYPFVTIVFEIRRPEEHHHVPVLLGAHGYTTYRGS